MLYEKRPSSERRNPNLVNAAINTHAIQNANTYAGTLSNTDYTNVRAVHNSLLLDCLNSGQDANFIAAANRVSPSQISLANLNQQQILQQIQIYSPSYSADTLQAALSAVHLDYDSVSTALSELQQYGLSNHYTTIVNLCDLIAATPTKTSGFNPILGPQRLPPPEPPGGDSGGGGTGRYSCQQDSAAIYAATTALVIISFMAGPFGVLTEVAFWSGFSLYGGLGASAWGLGHLKNCGL